ncbi:MAG: DUF4263 domain-containing protein [Candidatus Saccharibacteria bacterium]|nr:DUF4263 domain-containing protein [Candidatus Saccharibacteria bacterium]
MQDSIQTKYHKQGVSSVNHIILDETPTTRLIFYPKVHDSGVRGDIVRQKIGSDGQWKDRNDIDFRSLEADKGVKIPISTKATDLLFNKLRSLYEIVKKGAPRSNKELIVTESDKALTIDDRNKQRILQQIINQNYSESFWEELSKTSPKLATQFSIDRIQLDRQEVIKEFKTSLIQHANEEKYWQKFFEDNPWMLQVAFGASIFMLAGETYLGGKSTKGKQGRGGVSTDFLFADESTKSFAVMEIKKPKSSLMLKSAYRGKLGSNLKNEIYSLGSELSGAIVQAQSQLTVAIENFQSLLGDNAEFSYKINLIDPKAILVIGMSGELQQQRQKDSFNQFRSGLHSPIIVTFDELYHRLSQIYGISSQDEDIDSNDMPF